MSRTHPYDLHVTKAGQELTVEVKGSTTGGDSVFLTRNEVEHARRHADRAVLFVLHSVQLTDAEGVFEGTGGVARVFWPWQIDAGSLEALQFRYLPPQHEG